MYFGDISTVFFLSFYPSVCEDYIHELRPNLFLIFFMRPSNILFEVLIDKENYHKLDKLNCLLLFFSEMDIRIDNS